MNSQSNPKRQRGRTLRKTRNSTSTVLLAVLLLSVANQTIAADLILQGPARVTAEFQGTDDPLLFPASRWLVFSQQAPRGTLIQWAAVPFVQTRDNRFEVDSRLQITAVQQGNASIGVVVAQDETNYRAGDRAATVTAVLLQPGIARVDLQVGFIPRDASTVAAGEYVLRVVGTVTGN